ncbi:MAG: DUF1240 domain-containing protein [Serratia sp. (in: enterobacteria)]|uniref:DUF1240 domain-containing protein n=1 Tax=Serratia sp. (in: enterobacteria) TaxID=616 RepID=UPI003F3671BC
MDDVTKPIHGFFAVILLLLTCWLGWFSLSGYVAFFRLSDIVIFSWVVGLMIFGAPLMLYFLYVVFYSPIMNKPIKANNKLGNSLVILAMIGAVISLFSSIYIGHDLKGRGYKVCSKSSWILPNEYVKDIKLCQK